MVEDNQGKQKNLFKDALQENFKAEMDTQFGYKKLDSAV